MYTQFHVETSAGRVVCHRLADESLAPFVEGSRVALSWEPDHASLLGDSGEAGDAVEAPPAAAEAEV
jgi:hypothetical protein